MSLDLIIIIIIYLKVIIKKTKLIKGLKLGILFKTDNCLIQIGMLLIGLTFS